MTLGPYEARNALVYPFDYLACRTGRRDPACYCKHVRPPQLTASFVEPRPQRISLSAAPRGAPAK